MDDLMTRICDPEPRPSPPIPTVLVLDHRAGRVTLDGREVADFHQITDAIEVETVDGYVGMVTISLLARNVIVRSRSGETSSPTASDEARRIVRHGLAEVLRWLGEAVEE